MSRRGRRLVSTLAERGRRNPFSLFVIPAKAGIHFALVFVFWFSALTRRPTRIRAGSARIPASGSLLFACPKRSNQEKGHPRGRGSRASLPANCASRLRGLRTVRPCTGRKLAGILPAIAVATFPPPARRDLEGPGKSRARQSLPQKKAFDLGSLCEAAKVGRTRPRAPHAVRARTARIWRQGRSPAAKPRPTVANRRAAPARNRGCISLVTFFVQAKKGLLYT